MKEPFRLSDIIRDFKKFTANQLLPLLQLPQESRFTPVFTQQKLNYTHNNPVKAGIVEKPEDYLL
ncbi:hypothetical protein [Ilyomonas limi]|uniref:hypothetical protein n=1 Tax=Ilyomonas limi TaxID=2575867 RepID=UPI0019805268|nr:hypothetical protein [Ilyomonas limi]